MYILTSYVILIISMSRWEYSFILRRIYVLGVFDFLERNSLQPPLMSSDWLTKFFYRSVPEYLTHKATLLLSVADYKVRSFPRRFWPLRREGSLSCHTCYDTGLRFTRSHPKDRPWKSLHTTNMGFYNDLSYFIVILSFSCLYLC